MEVLLLGLVTRFPFFYIVHSLSFAVDPLFTQYYFFMFKLWNMFMFQLY